MIDEITKGNLINNFNRVLKINYDSVTCSGQSFSGMVEVDVPVGIPLSLESLERLGLEVIKKPHETSGWGWKIDLGMLQVIEVEGEVFVNLRIGGGKTELDHVKYIHRLQNLYFDLHNEHLIDA